MDAEKFGRFIADMRKEKNMTQAELAEKLNVTDKAVSRWERGLGFPDINTIEPLAEALGMSVLEIMRSEKSQQKTISENVAAEALTDAFELVKQQRAAERKTILVIGICTAILSLSVFLIDVMGWYGAVLVCFPAVCLVVSLVLAIYGIYRKRNRLHCAQTFVLAGVVFLVPVAIVLLLFIAGVMGIGPVPD